jgi:hypothetical protein
MIFWLVLKLEIGYNRVKISWRILVSFGGFFWRLWFYMVKYLSFHNSSFALRLIFNVNGKAKVLHIPLLHQQIFLSSCHMHLKKQFILTPPPKKIQENSVIILEWMMITWNVALDPWPIHVHMRMCRNMCKYLQCVAWLTPGITMQETWAKKMWPL